MKYEKGHNLVIVTAGIIILWYFGISTKGFIPLLNINIPATEKLPYILLCVLFYGVIQLFIGWGQIDIEKRKLLSSKIDLILTVAIVGISIFLFFKKLGFLFTLPKINILSFLTIVAVGIFTGKIIDLFIFNLSFIRSKKEARRKALPRVPVAVRASWRFVYILFPLLLVIIFLSPSFSKPLSTLWYWFLFIPMLLIPLIGLLEFFIRHKDKNGNLIPRKKFISDLQKVFDRHDADYQLGGWDKPVEPSNSLLYEAAEQGDIDVVKKLLSKNIEVNAQNVLGWTPLLIAVAEQHEKIVKVLLDHGANPNQSNLKGRNPIMFAARYANKSLTEILLRNGADPNLNESNDPGSLSAAAISGNQEVVELLLNSGAKPLEKDFYKKTAIDYAEACKQGQIAAILRLKVGLGLEPKR